jgi:putative transposase
MRLALKLRMPRKPLVRSTEFPYHLTGRSNNREHFPGSLEMNWHCYGEKLTEVSERYRIRVHAFVLMPNHFHLLMSTPREDLGIVMQCFMASVTRTINAKTNRSGRIFGSRYHPSLITSTQYFDSALKYVYRNPVKAKLKDRVLDYRFSTLKGACGFETYPFSLYPPSGYSSLVPNQSLDSFIQWLDTPFTNEQDEAIGTAFQKSQFKLPKSGWKRKPTNF